MATLTGVSISSSYTSLLKLDGNTDSTAAGNGSNAIQVKTGDNDATPLYLNTDRLGIGIQPATVLDVSAGVNSAHSTFSGQAGRGLLIETQATTNNDDTVVLNAQTSTGEIAFETNSTEKMRINSSTVIIGTHNSNAHRLSIESKHSSVPYGQLVAGSSDQNQAVGFQFTVRNSSGDEIDKMFLTDTGLGI